MKAKKDPGKGSMVKAKADKAMKAMKGGGGEKGASKPSQAVQRKMAMKDQYKINSGATMGKNPEMKPVTKPSKPSQAVQRKMAMKDQYKINSGATMGKNPEMKPVTKRSSKTLNPR